MNEERESSVDYRNRFVCDMLKSQGRTKFESIADFGCGDGRLLDALMKKLGASRGIGIDLAAEPERSTATIHFRQANILDYEPDEPCELVTSIQVFEHIYEPWLERFFQSLKRACKTGGMILISTPNRWRPGNLVRVATLRKPAMMQANPGIPPEQHLGHHRECSYREMSTLIGQHFSEPEWRFRIARPIPRNTGSVTLWMINLAVYCGLSPAWRPLCVSASHDHYVIIEHQG